MPKNKCTQKFSELWETVELRLWRDLRTGFTSQSVSEPKDTTKAKSGIRRALLLAFSQHQLLKRQLTAEQPYGKDRNLPEKISTTKDIKKERQ